MSGGLRTDLYELNMAASYLRRGMTDTATFSLTVRALPAERGFLVAAGLEPALDSLEALSFEEPDLRYLREELGFDPETVEAFARLRFDGDVWAVPEGTVVTASEPILEVDAPLPAAQLVETVLLNIVTLHTLLASKAVRYRLAAPDADLVDFAYRRAHGHEAAFAAARSSAIAGFAATSNVAAARELGLRAAGTMAHSYIEAFPDERSAFLAFAEDVPSRTTFLVDTYDTVAGVETAIEVIEELNLAGSDRALGVRLDSGDLDELSRRARALLDGAGLRRVRIFASGGLDELEVARLVRLGAPIDAYGIGTQMGVSADAPSLDSVYKLVEVGGRGVMKLSTGKRTLPGAKQVFRSSRADARDVLGLREEPAPPGSSPLLAPVMRNGRRERPPPAIAELRDRCAEEVARLPAEVRALETPLAPEAAISPPLGELTERIEREHRRSPGG